MICDRCRIPIAASGNPDQPLCGRCLAHLRAGGAWVLGSPAARPQALGPIDPDLLPLRAHVLYEPVPLYPIEGDFHLAASVVAAEPHEPAAHWRIEAIRERRAHAAIAFDPEVLGRIAARVAVRMARTERNDPR